MMSNKFFFLLVFFIAAQQIAMAEIDLPIDTLSSRDMSKPLVLYISGDGGFNSFSTSFMKQWNGLGYPVVALNSRTYFFTSQSPDDAARDMAALLTEYMSLWKRSNIILVGYSFGADVLPFIQTRLPASITSKIQHTVLLSPSHYTDFAVHLFYKHQGSNVPAEINKLSKPALVVFGDEEADIADKEINNQQVTIFKVTGDHHYDKQVNTLVAEILKRI